MSRKKGFKVGDKVWLAHKITLDDSWEVYDHECRVIYIKNGQCRSYHGAHFVGRVTVEAPIDLCFRTREKAQRKCDYENAKSKKATLREAFDVGAAGKIITDQCIEATMRECIKELDAANCGFAQWQIDKTAWVVYQNKKGKWACSLGDHVKKITSTEDGLQVEFWNKEGNYLSNYIAATHESAQAECDRRNLKQREQSRRYSEDEPSISERFENASEHGWNGLNKELDAALKRQYNKLNARIEKLESQQEETGKPGDVWTGVNEWCKGKIPGAPPTAVEFNFSLGGCISQTGSYAGQAAGVKPRAYDRNETELQVGDEIMFTFTENRQCVTGIRNNNIIYINPGVVGGNTCLASAVILYKRKKK